VTIFVEQVDDCDKKKRKSTQAAKKLLTSIKEKRPLGKKKPLHHGLWPEKKKVVSEDQEGCGQTSQQTSPY